MIPEGKGRADYSKVIQSLAKTQPTFGLADLESYYGRNQAGEANFKSNYIQCLSEIYQFVQSEAVSHTFEARNSVNSVDVRIRPGENRWVFATTMVIAAMQSGLSVNFDATKLEIRRIQRAFWWDSRYEQRKIKERVNFMLKHDLTHAEFETEHWQTLFAIENPES